MPCNHRLRAPAGAGAVMRRPTVALRPCHAAAEAVPYRVVGFHRDAQGFVVVARRTWDAVLPNVTAVKVRNHCSLPR